MARITFAFFLTTVRSVLPLGMIKLNDVVRVEMALTRVKPFKSWASLTKIALASCYCRLYRSQYRFNFMPWQIEIHPFFVTFNP